MGALILEVKGDFCHRVRDILQRHGRGDDYIEVSLESPYRYNPLHNDLEAYALAYGIATLMTNLFGRGKEPFWQQASTNLIKFVILLHQTVDAYVTLFQVYKCAINPDKLQAKIAEGERLFAARTQRPVVKTTESPGDRRPRAVGVGAGSGRQDVVRRVVGRSAADAGPGRRRARDAGRAPSRGARRCARAVRGGEAVVHRRLDAHRAEAAHLHRRGRQRVPCPCSTTTRG